MKDIKGLVVIVTGASSGIGDATAREKQHIAPCFHPEKGMGNNVACYRR